MSRWTCIAGPGEVIKTTRISGETYYLAPDKEVEFTGSRNQGLIGMKDSTGRYFMVEVDELSSVVFKHMSALFGLSPERICDIRAMYHAAGGAEPMTEESLKQFELRRKR